MAWQAWRDGQADILLAEVEGTEEPANVSRDPANDWSPALAFDKNGRAFVAFDSYRSGNYDVFLWTGGPAGGRLIPVAATARYEARPTVAIDPRGRAWVAYEERDANWGKDAENLVKGKGSTLYRSAAVKVRCVDGDRVLEAPDPVAGAPNDLRLLNGYPRIAADRDGRIWLAFRHRLEAIWGGPAVMVVGAVWTEYATALAGKAWEAPQPLPRSDGLLDNRPALVMPADGPALAFYSSDGRLRREARVHARADIAVLDAPRDAGRRRCALQRGSRGGGAAGRSSGATSVDPATVPPAPTVAPPPPVHPDEAADVARMRDYRIQAGGKAYRLLRGDFHRHTELSMDGGPDGSLEDMWRYAIDAAALDWIGNNDHDNGGGKEYTWWLTQKTTDLYNNPKLVGMFSYERSNAYPHGHRNVMFPRRGIRTLPRLVDRKGLVDDDTAMLYDYLKEHGGVCASHSSATTMGTDWRDVNPEYEPMVEIFSGHWSSAEHLGAPRVARRPNEAARRLEAPGTGLECAGDAIQAGLPGVQRPHLDPHLLRRRDRRGREPRGDLRCVQAAALLRCHRQHRARRPKRRPSHGGRVHRRRSGPPRYPGPRHAADRSGGHHQGLRLRLLHRAQSPARPVPMAGRGDTPRRPELVLCPRRSGQWRNRVGQPILGPHSKGAATVDGNRSHVDSVPAG